VLEAAGDVLPVGVGPGGTDDVDGELLTVGVAEEEVGIEVADVEPLGFGGALLDGTLDELGGELVERVGVGLAVADVVGGWHRGA
jgi:hypothetical protein